jgi:zinc transport system permease protein
MSADAGWWPDWALFGDALVVGVLLAAVLPCFGVLLVLRQQVFVAAAIGQAANFGIALALASGLAVAHGHGQDDAEHRTFVVGAGLLAAVGTAIAALRRLSARASTLEAHSALVFLGGSAGAMVLLADQPHGLQELQRLFLSSLLAVDRADLGWAFGTALATAAALATRSRHLLGWALEPRAAAAHGTPIGTYDLVVGAVLGIAIGQAIHATGLLFTFGATILPVLAARELAGSLRTVLVLAPSLGAGGMVAAFALGHRLDLPPGQLAVALWAGLVATSAVLRRARAGHV